LLKVLAQIYITLSFAAAATFTCSFYHFTQNGELFLIFLQRVTNCDSFIHDEEPSLAFSLEVFATCHRQSASATVGELPFSYHISLFHASGNPSKEMLHLGKQESKVVFPTQVQKI
jgi:hypothetical protein